MKIKIDTIERYLSDAAGKYIGKDEAAVFARLYMETHLRKSPSMNPLQEAVNDIHAWQVSVAADPDIAPSSVSDKPGVILYDFKRLPPSLKIKEIHDHLEKKAREKTRVSLPGDRGEASRNKALACGEIEVEPKLVEVLKNLARRE